MPKIKAIVAMSLNRAIGFENKIPWHLPEDQKRFAKLTKGHIVLMGRKTYESLPEKFRPLPNRKNIVCTRNSEWKPDEELSENLVVSALSLKETIQGLKNEAEQDIWIIGGAEIYKQTAELWDEVYLTLVKENYEGDSFFPEFEESFKETFRADFDEYTYINYKSNSK